MAASKSVLSAPADSASARGLRGLYREVAAHLDGCELKTEYLSDTWRHTLKQKGRLHPYEDLLTMFAVGNRVNSWIDDFNYLNDASVLPEDDAVLARVLALGPSEFGSPRKQLRLGRRDVSCQFVQQSLFAAKLIRAIEARGISSPSVMEIGGGLGGLARILRAYYGERLTYYAVDLPETLAIQEWFLRASFPSAPTAYKGTSRPAAFARGGLNFINAYALESQRVPIDVAVNIDSMQEMNSDAVGAYVRYFEANLSPRGLFYFQNHFGHSAAGVREPSDYPLDERWTVAAAEVVPQIEVCSEGIQLRLILERTGAREDPQSRRLVLRALWNAFMSGRPAHATALVAELARLPARLAPAKAAAAAARALRAHGVPFSDAEARRLLRSPYVAEGRAYVGAYDARPRPGARLGFTLGASDALWRAQSRLLALMDSAAARAATPDEARRGVAAAARLLPAAAAARSDYWSAHVAAVQLALGQGRAGALTLDAAVRASQNHHWLVRFAYLASRFGLADAADRALARLDGRELDYFVALKAAELAAPRDARKAAAALAALAPAAGAESARLWSLARTAGRAGLADLAARTAARALALCPGTSAETVLGVLRSCAPGARSPELVALARGLERPAAGRLEEDHAVFFGFVLAELGEAERGLALAEAALERFRDDYFRLGQLGRLLQGAGRDDLADRALARSLALRPGTFLHHDFVGDVYLGAKRYGPARRQFERALALRPYPRHIQAKRLYCSLPAALRDSGVFGRPSDWNLIFQRRHDFYHDIAPSTK
jgi:putative sugar O-methyltransferase